MNSQIQFCTLKSQDFSDIFDIIIKANTNSYPFIIQKYQTLEKFEEQTRQIIQQCFKSQKKYMAMLNREMEYIYGIRFNGKLIAVMLSLDLIEECESMKPLLADKTNLLYLFATQMASLNIESLSPGTASYFARLSVLPQLMGKGIGQRLVYEACKYQLQKGYQHSIISTVVEPSVRLFTKLGGQVLRCVEEPKPTFLYKITIIKNDFKKVVQKYEQPRENEQNGSNFA